MPWQGDLTFGMRLILYHKQKYLDLLPAESRLRDYELGLERRLGVTSNRSIKGQIFVATLLKIGQLLQAGNAHMGDMFGNDNIM